MGRLAKAATNYLRAGLRGWMTAAELVSFYRGRQNISSVFHSFLQPTKGEDLAPMGRLYWSERYHTSAVACLVDARKIGLHYHNTRAMPALRHERTYDRTTNNSASFSTRRSPRLIRSQAYDKTPETSQFVVRGRRYGEGTICTSVCLAGAV